MAVINFQNLPSTTTPLNATNLNAIQIQDSGSSSNRYYIKFADGTMIQYGRYTFSSGLSVTNQYGGIYYAIPSDEISFPIAFYNDNYSLSTSISTAGVGGCSISSRETTYFKVKVFNGSSASSLKPTIFWIATGRWKA